MAVVVGSVSETHTHVEILGCTLNSGGAQAARSRIQAALEEPWDGRCLHIATLNPEYVMLARRNTSFASALSTADLVTADGMGVTVAARLLHDERIQRVTGVDIVEWLAEWSGSMNAPLFLLGAGPGVADLAAAKLARRFPGARFAGTWSEGGPNPALDEESLRRIDESGARCVAVAYGAPGQVEWIDRNRSNLSAMGVRLAIGIGGALDYHSGVIARPPELVRRLGLEWLVRLLREPARIKRQLVLPHFAALVLRDTITSRFAKRT